MRLIAPTRLVKAFVGASLTFLAMALIAPGSARAGCEHPLERPTIGLDAFKADGMPATGMPATATGSQAPRPKPCTGPSCSNRSAPSPTSTSSPQPPPRAELWGVLVEPLPVDPPGSSARVSDANLDRPILVVPPIFHPPRLPR